jgi:type VI secretion system Hcp family effector
MEDNMRSTTSFTLHAALATVLIALAAASAAAADAYLKFGTVKGEVPAREGGKDWIELDSYQWGHARGVSAAAGGSESGGGRADVAGTESVGGAPAATETTGGMMSAATTQKRQHKPMTITKEMDRTAVSLAQPLSSGSMSFKGQLTGCAAGTHYPSATLETRTYKYEFQDVVITSCATGGSEGGGGSLPMEEISFNYGQIKTVYAPSKQDEQKTKVRGWDPNKKEE